mgnify:CR=1 FL=1
MGKVNYAAIDSCCNGVRLLKKRFVLAAVEEKTL